MMHPFDELEAKSDRLLAKLCELTNADLQGGADVHEVAAAAGLDNAEKDSIFNYLREQGYIKLGMVGIATITSEGLRRLKAVQEGGSASGSSSSVIYNISGPNARVNINSQDASVNVVDVTADNLFDELKSTVQRAIPNDHQRSELLQCIEALKRAQSTPDFWHYYQQFISLTADHLAVFQSFLPALTQMFGS